MAVEECEMGTEISGSGRQLDDFESVIASVAMAFDIAVHKAVDVEPGDLVEV